MKYFFSIILALNIFSIIISGQTSEDMERYLHSTEQTNNPSKNLITYGNISVAVKFDNDGQICQAVFPMRPYSTSAVTPKVSSLNGEEIKGILYSLAPAEIRGNPIEPLGLSEMSGNGIYTTFTYQNVIVRTSLTFKYSTDEPLQGDFVLLDRPDDIISDSKNNILESNNNNKAEHYFERLSKTEEMSSANIVTVTWTKRQCSE